MRTAARRMLASVLSCQVDASSSGLVARHAGIVAGADQYLPTMASEAFLGCLSKAALTNAAAENGVRPGERAKDTRATMIRAFAQRTYLHPAARFALSEQERAAERAKLMPVAEEEPIDEPGAEESDEAREPLDEAA